jgi:hypothetical protein
MITLEKLLTELKAESLNEIVAAGCGGRKGNGRGKGKRGRKGHGHGSSDTHTGHKSMSTADTNSMSDDCSCS